MENKVGVINISINSNHPDPTKPDIDISELYKIFWFFGKINKIMIYDRKDQVKAFLEFQKISQARKVVETLNNQYINNYGLIKVYLSKYNSLKLNNKHTEYKNFITGEQNNTYSLKKSAKQYYIKNIRSTAEGTVSLHKSKVVLASNLN